jgi:AcrR family transcriptional regulator
VPIQVDREQQRAHVNALGLRLVADEGVGALTFRRVAEAAGTSTAIVSTYFADKRDLLLSTLRTAATHTSVRFETAEAAGRDLQTCLEAWLPLDEERRTDWRVIIAFWGAAVADPELAAVQHGHVSRARDRVAQLVQRSDPRSPAEIGRLAHEVVALTLGIAVQAVFAPGSPDARGQRRLLADGLTRFGLAGG